MFKPFLSATIAVTLLLSGVAAAKNNTVDYNEVSIPQLRAQNYGSEDHTVTFDDREIGGGSNFYYLNNSTWFNNTAFSWDEGASGEIGDFAPHVEAASDSAYDFAYDTDQIYLYLTQDEIGADERPFVTEFDIKLNTDTDSVRWYSVKHLLWHDGIDGDEAWRLFDSDGKIKGTDYSYPTGCWIHMKMIYYPLDMVWNVYVTDAGGVHHIVENKKASYRNVGWMPASGSRAVMTLRQDSSKNAGEKRAGFSVDNYKVYYLEKKDVGNGSASVNYSKGQCSLDLNFESTENQETHILVASFDGDDFLKTIEMINYASNEGSNRLNQNLADENQIMEAKHIKVFVWDKNMVPLCDTVTATYDGILISNGSGEMEAEDMLTSDGGAAAYACFYTEESGKLSGDGGIKITQDPWENGAECPDIMYSPVIIPESEDDGMYKVWVRQRTLRSDTSSIFVDEGDGRYVAEFYDSAIDGEYRWSEHVAYFKKGANYIAYRPRTQIIVDKIIITNNLGFTPVEKGDYPSSLSEKQQEQSFRLMYAEPLEKPIAGHPRLMVTKDGLEDFKTRISDNDVSWMRDKFLGYAKETLNTTLDTTQSNNHDSFMLVKLQSRALAWLIGEEKSPAYARQTIDYMKEYLRTVRTPDDMGDITRERGDILVCASIVYDWCYDALTDADKTDFKKYMMNIVATKEIGWPADNMSDIASHAGEQEIFRDLLSCGIAIYDEYPILYDVAAGRMFEKMIPARLWLRNTGRFDNGNDYGECRAYSEFWGDYLMQTMGCPSIFGNIGTKALRSLIYSRMPYGAMLPSGDMYSLTQSEYKSYYRNYYTALAFAASLYNDPYIKAELRRCRSVGNFPETEQFWYMMVSRPDTGEKVWDDLPLSVYTSYPLSGIIARTDWQEGFNSRTAMAFMDMHEGYVGDHQHKYTGSFEIYYKGLLSMNTGTYNYSNSHNEGYSHRAIAANTMLVQNPEETFKSSWGNWPVQNDGGQRLPYSNGSTVMSLSEYNLDENGIIQNKELEVANNVRHYIGPNEDTPEYSYISGDLKNAYSDKVDYYIRSMAFIDTDNEEYPAAFVVFDKIKSSDASFKKTFLLHSQEEPEFSGNKTIIERKQNGFGGRLVNSTLLPQNPEIKAVGGNNNEMFTINGYEYGSQTDTIEGGKYRIEISPGVKSAEDVFLNAMYITDAGNTKELVTSRIESKGFIGVNFQEIEKSVMFNNGEIKSTSFDINLPKGSVLLSGIAAGTWKISSSSETVYAKSDSDSMVLCFKASGGDYTIAPVAAANILQVEKTNKKKIGSFFIRKQNSSYIGEFIYLEHPTITVDARQYIPVDALREFGATVFGDSDSCSISKSGNEAVITKNTTAYMLNGRTEYLRYPAISENGVLYVFYNDLTNITQFEMESCSSVLITAKPR